MRRSPWLMMMLTALLVWWAARVVPQALGLNSASVNVGGTLQVAATNTTAFVTCTAPATFTGSVAVYPNPNSVVVTCYNNTNAALSVVLTLTTLIPSSTPAPYVSWTNALPIQTTVTISVPANGNKTQRLYAYAPNGTPAGTYTQTFTSTTSFGNVDFLKSLTVKFTV